MGADIKSFRDLIVWQKAMDLVDVAYRLTSGFPSEERYGLASQLRRAAVSVPSNVAEGYGRHSTADYVRFLQIALGSLNECITQLEISVRLEFVGKDEIKEALELCAEIEKMLVSLVKKLRVKRDG
ncbi:four helix bundle protein [Pontiella sp.]|uniref:four helix bundle protein n=1 Tax=Pontiella sp. TaxID=2837462 RepID=UPI00356606F9